MPPSGRERPPGLQAGQCITLCLPAESTNVRPPHLKVLCETPFNGDPVARKSSTLVYQLGLRAAPGTSLYLRLRARHSQSKFICLSGYFLSQHLRRAPLVGCSWFSVSCPQLTGCWWLPVGDLSLGRESSPNAPPPTAVGCHWPRISWEVGEGD